MKTEVLIVGGSASWALETYYCKHLNEIGIKTEIFTTANFINYSIFTKVRSRLNDISIYKSINTNLIKECFKTKPKIIWIFKGIEIFTETISFLKQNGFFLVNYNPDHPYIRTSKSHGGNNIPDSVPLYDLHFSYRKDLVSYFNSTIGIKSFLLPFGFELDDEDYLKLNSLSEVKKLCFIGTPDRERVNMLCSIAKEGFQIDIYSQTYQDKHKLARFKNINTFDVVLGQTFWEKIRSYRVQLNFFRQHNIGSHNQRTFEVPAAGGILLTPYSEDQDQFFKSESEIFFYKNDAGLLDSIDVIMSMQDEEINLIRQSARQRSTSSNYSYKNRSEFVGSIFKTI